MYSVINRFQDRILGSLTRHDIEGYDWLVRNRSQSLGTAYQNEYRRYWGMNRAQLSSTFYQAYFVTLAAPTWTPTLSKLCQTLYGASTRRNGSRTLQFSFATKLLHIRNPHLPIYDSHVKRFYLFREPQPGAPVEQRIESLIEFHNFLTAEYARVIRDGILSGVVTAFRQQFNPQHTDEKIIDWLIWKLVELANDKAILRGQITYG